VVREKLEAEGGDGNCERLSMVSVGLSGWVGVVAWRSVPGVSNRDCTGSVFKVEPMERAPIQRVFILGLALSVVDRLFFFWCFCSHLRSFLHSCPVTILP
jgi:hypothetical protein